ncbi:MAG: poly-gamma-glutamate synthase PgsB [Bacteroidales bacterium]|nr:poly-gamma-glutamate synthase PgsB [Bacteroidales bacterium]
MSSLIIISLITISMIIYGVFEYKQHHKYLNTIPIRIHVNGTRGKSSVTRLIGAGLRAGGYNTITKVTGTFPRMILNNGTEVIVHRKEKANILEQLKIVKFCSLNKSDVLLIECMALQPNFQKITEHQMIKATHGVITNIRMDHLDVMGPRLENVAEALSGTIPRNAKLFTAEDRMLDFLLEKAGKLKTEVTATDGNEISETDMEGFTYFEHPENVALALSICRNLGVDRALALKSMKNTIPDEGALRKYTIIIEGKNVNLYNALAANDPESSVILWNNIRKMEGDDKQYVIILNSRRDRKERSEQLINAVSNLSFDEIFLIGENVELVKNMGIKAGIPRNKMLLIGQKDSKMQLSDMIPKLEEESVLIAFGNMGAGGAEFVKQFELQNRNI